MTILAERASAVNSQSIRTPAQWGKYDADNGHIFMPEQFGNRTKQIQYATAFSGARANAAAAAFLGLTFVSAEVA